MTVKVSVQIILALQVFNLFFAKYLFKNRIIPETKNNCFLTKNLFFFSVKLLHSKVYGLTFDNLWRLGRGGGYLVMEAILSARR